MTPWLDGLELPATKDDAIDHAEARGAPPEVLALLESLPAAVFSSRAGIAHALGTLGDGAVPAHPDGETAEDGNSD